MTKSRAVHYLLCFALLFAIVGGLAGNQVVHAAQQGSNGSFSVPPNQEEEEEETLELKCRLPVLNGKSGDIFEFEVNLEYTGSERRRFDLTTTIPPEWRALILASYPERQISAVEPEPGGLRPSTEPIKIRFAPLPWKFPEPGEYIVTLEAASEDLTASIELKAVVTARYEFAMYLAEDMTLTRRISTEVTAGEDNPLSIVLVNTGTAAIENITFSSAKEAGWSITFSPDRIDSLEPGLTQEVNVVIKPPRRTIAGWWEATLYAESKEVFDELEIKINVLTPGFMGWIAILIVVLVVAGLGVLFWRLGRR